MSRQFGIACLLALTLTGCNSVYYKTMKTLGKEKRDILVKRIKDTKKDQEETKERLKTTMESFQELTGFQGGDLEKNYKRLNGDYEKAADQANKLHDRIQSIDQVSNDMFKEWKKRSTRCAIRNSRLAALQCCAMPRSARPPT